MVCKDFFLDRKMDRWLYIYINIYSYIYKEKEVGRDENGNIGEVNFKGNEWEREVYRDWGGIEI